jgi:uncharacterized protein YyaL (SSP411 family)
MTIRTQPRKVSRQPQKRTPKQNQAITNLEPRRLGWSGLADVIIQRAMIWEEAQSSSPARAKKIHASEEAVRLAKLERQLWRDICSMAAEQVLCAPVTKEGGNSRRLKLMPIVERRLRRMFTDATSALLPGARLASPELGPERKIGRQQRSVQQGG